MIGQFTVGMLARRAEMAHFRQVAVLLLMAMMTTSIIPVVAQDDAAGPFDDLSQLEGIETALRRTYFSEDFFALLTATPEDADGATIAELDGPLLVFMQVMKFDSAGNAESAYQLVKDEGGASVGASIEDAETESGKGEIDNLGDDAIGIDLHSTADGEEGFFRIAFAREDAFIFAVITAAVTEGGIESNDSLLEFMVNDGEASDDAEEFAVGGGSTGGFWGFFPDDDHDGLNGLIPLGDENLFPVLDDQ